jgi:hypothetical protein
MDANTLEISCSAPLGGSNLPTTHNKRRRESHTVWIVFRMAAGAAFGRAAAIGCRRHAA